MDSLSDSEILYLSAAFNKIKEETEKSLKNLERLSTSCQEVLESAQKAARSHKEKIDSEKKKEQLIENDCESVQSSEEKKFTQSEREAEEVRNENNCEKLKRQKFNPNALICKNLISKVTHDLWSPKLYTLIKKYARQFIEESLKRTPLKIFQRLRRSKCDDGG